MSTPFYETDRAVSEYLLFHYGAAEEILPYSFGPPEALDFAVRSVRECLDPGRLPPRPRALDLGCAVGRSAFELARYCSEVIGIDFSRRFIEAANQLKKDGALEFAAVEEGDLSLWRTARVPPEIERDRIHFEQGDAMNLREGLGAFDVVLLANLIDRLSDPKRCVMRLRDLVREGGQLILTSPYTWLEDYTPKSNWLGGFERAGQPVRTINTLRDLLEGDFELTRELDLPLLIREHVRKFQWSVAHGTVWVRR
jgi:putative 4-mercaptohistidine N1-methyltranferase